MLFTQINPMENTQASLSFVGTMDQGVCGGEEGGAGQQSSGRIGAPSTIVQQALPKYLGSASRFTALT